MNDEKLNKTIDALWEHVYWARHRHDEQGRRHLLGAIEYLKEQRG